MDKNGDKSSNTLSKFLKQTNRQTRLLILFSALGLLIILSISFLVPFKDKLLSLLYPKPKSQAATITQRRISTNIEASKIDFIGPSIVNGKAISPNVKLKLTYVPMVSTSTQLGMQIDIGDSNKVPTISQLQDLNPSWVRYVYRPSKSLPSYGSNVKHLIIFNHESLTAPAPITNTEEAVWRDYIDRSYLVALQSFISNYSSLDAIEIWNEEDVCSGGYCPKVPPRSYAYMLKQAASIIKSQNPAIKVIMGGLASGDISYLEFVKNAESNVFAQIDAIGIHPYGKSPDNWCSACNASLVSACVADSASLKVQWDIKNVYGGNSCNIYINDGQRDYQINGTNNAGPCAGSMKITSLGSQPIRPGTRYRLYVSNGDPNGGCYNEQKGENAPSCQVCSGDLNYSCGASNYPNNRLRADWNIPQSSTSGACNIFIRGGSTDHTISQSCTGSWEDTKLPGESLPITNDGIYQLYVNNGDSSGSCYNQLKAESRLNCGFSECADNLPFGNLASAISQVRSTVPNKSIWVSEVGNPSLNQDWQADYLRRIYTIFNTTQIPVFIWYAWIDTMAGNPGEESFGLVRADYTIKPVGRVFNSLSSQSADLYPTHFRLANTSNGLVQASEQTFNQGQEIDWRLTDGNGSKTVFAQFKVNGVWESPISANIILEVPVTQTINLQKGWNLIGITVNKAGYKAANFLSDLRAGEKIVDSVYRWYQGKWDFFTLNPISTQAVPVVTGFDILPGAGYWIYSSSNTSRSLTGAQVSLPSLTFSAGWNLISFPLVSSSVNTASKLSSELQRQGFSVSSLQRWINGRWETYLPLSPLTGFDILPGVGYFVNLTSLPSSGSFILPSTTLSSVSVQAIPAKASLPCTPYTTDIDKNSRVTGNDLGRFVACNNKRLTDKDKKGNLCKASDTNADLRIDKADYDCIRANIGKSYKLIKATKNAGPVPALPAK